ncbi:MAG: CoA pyrophosphatase [Cyclobacteriaceae bacterium]|nr:CoA pyrophosphatase [Cyclobacteriaceae bacterium]
MSWEEIIQRLEVRLTQPLLRDKAHEPLRATPTGLIKPKFEHKVPPKPGSVLILLYPEGGRLKFPLTKRQEYVGAHSAQVSFPGGKSEPNEDYIETALREAEEEIGVSRNLMQVIGKLSPFFVIPSNFLVTPVVAFAERKPHFIPQLSEVDKIIEGDVEELLRDDAVLTKEIVAAKIYPMLAPHFEIEGEVVWGATAMMLNEFRLLMKEAYHS